MSSRTLAFHLAVVSLTLVATGCTVNVDALQAKLVDTCQLGFVTPPLHECDNADELADLAFAWQVQRDVPNADVEACLLERACDELNDCFPATENPACRRQCDVDLLNCGTDCSEAGLAACLQEDDACRDAC